MKPLLATLITLASLLLAAPAAVACEENFCKNRPSATADPTAKPQTRALKKKPKKECGSTYCERSATADSDAQPQTRALKKKPKKEECDENFCN